jgi:hypothetical protein
MSGVLVVSARMAFQSQFIGSRFEKFLKKSNTGVGLFTPDKLGLDSAHDVGGADRVAIMH